MDGTILGKKYDLMKEGGGGGGTSDYEQLSNLPKINSVELKGNKSLNDLGIASSSDLNTLAGVVGDSTEGLVKDVNDIESVIPESATTSNKLATMADVGGGGIESPTQYDTTGLTYSGFNRDEGGYFKLGNAVFINIMVEATESGNCTINGFPVYTSQATNNFVHLETYDTTYFDQNKDTVLTRDGSLTFVASGGRHYVITGFYLANVANESSKKKKKS